jgi:cytosine/adenosine deaminase-related metal-dependent hydrolase
MCVSIGTDNVMVNSLDLFEELRYLNRVYRVITKNSELPARELLKMVTINAARNFLIDENYGTIALNKYADFFCVDLNHPNYYANDLEASLIYALIVERTRSENVKKVYIKGELEHERC